MSNKVAKKSKTKKANPAPEVEPEELTDGEVEEVAESAFDPNQLPVEEVMQDLEAEIGRLTVQLRMSNLQNRRREMGWAKEREQYQMAISELSKRLDGLESRTSQPSAEDQPGDPVPDPAPAKKKRKA